MPGEIVQAVVEKTTCCDRFRNRQPLIFGLSGGPDSVYLFTRLLKSGEVVVVGHLNHGLRGKQSNMDEEFVRSICAKTGVPSVCGQINKDLAKGKVAFKEDNSRFLHFGIEEGGRIARYSFLYGIMEKFSAKKIILAHTADDQVETVLMRVFEGAGISGLKGIPRETGDGIVRPILHVWKEDIIEYLKKNKIPYRVDKSNLDTRFERNWMRHILIPLLEKRYGKSVKKRIFALGERFRELDEYLETEAVNWIRRTVKSGQHAGGVKKIVGKVPTIITKDPQRTRLADKEGNIHFPRDGYSRLPTVLRVRILQKLCFDRLALAPNERLLAAMDKVVCTHGPSVRLKVGKGWELVNRYERAAFVSAGGEGRVGKAPRGAGPGEPVLKMEDKGKVTPAQARRAAASGGKEYFDAAGIRLPLSVRPLRAGDRIRPFGLNSEKKVKEILIDRKIPRDERWGRPVVCDADGTILWIPGVVRSAHAPVGPKTEKTVLLKLGQKMARK